MMRPLNVLHLLLYTVIEVSCGTDYPCYTNWAYSMLSGKCYLLFTITSDYQTALAACQAQSATFQQPPNAVSLSKIETLNDADGMRNVLITQGNNALLWLDATVNGNAFQWSSGSVVNMNMLTSISPSFTPTGPCFTIIYTYTMTNGGSTLDYLIQNSPCNASATYLCQHPAKSCSPGDLPLYSSSVETLVPPLTTVGSMPYVACNPGNYRSSELQPSSPASSGSIPFNYANCTGTQSPNMNPFTYTPRWVLNNAQTTIEPCLGISCPIFNATVINVQNQIVIPDSQKKSSYNFGDNFPVTCNLGYVNYLDKTTNTASMTCAQSISNKNIGVWNPMSNMPCTPLMCNLTALISMVPGNGMLTSALNRATQRQYNVNLQMSSLPYYNNIVTITCNDGYFFSDRSYQKSVICGLANNSLVKGAWLGYLGTTLPLDPICQSATCSFESILISSSMNLQPSFYMMDSNGVYQNVTEISTNPYPYQTKMRFLCRSNYSSVTQTPDQNLTCGPKGVWIPNLTPCVQTTAAIQLGNNLHFYPPAVDAPAAQQIGYVVIIILVVFLSLIIILDVSTISRDVKIMKSNIKNVKRYVNRNKK